MRDGSSVVKRFLGQSEHNYLRYGLRLDATPTVQKRALQALCEYYEAGRRMDDSTDVRQMIHSHLGSPEVLVRRWALKALALIGHPDDFQRIVDRLRVETDPEAQTWGVTALIKNARGLGLNEVCKMASIEKSSSLLLAARLYAQEKWLVENAEPVSINLNADELTLKWAVFLIGYDKAPEDLFDPRHNNEIFLGELNNHDASDISEYSLWALWERKEFGAAYSRIPLASVGQHPESVRKWLYRLATQSPSQVELDAAAFADLRCDSSARAREGLALGVADLDPAIFANEVLDWYTVENNDQVRENLLASMAVKSHSNTDYADAVERRFRNEQADSRVRRRLLAASENTALYANLRHLDIAAAQDKQGLLTYDRPQIHIYGDFNMNKATLNVGGNLTAQTLAVGDMFNSANAAVQQLKNSDQDTAAVLREVLAMLSASGIDQGKADVVEAVEKVAKTPSSESKNGLVSRLVEYGATAAKLGGAISGLDKLIEATRNILP